MDPIQGDIHITGEVNIIPTTIPTTDALLEQAVELNERVSNNPDLKIILGITHKLERATIFNTIYCILLTFLLGAVGFIGYITWHNGNVVQGLVDLCQQDNKDKAADLASWKFIINQFPTETEQLKVILAQREVIDKPVDC